MACSFCGHTMQNLGVESQRIFWCPRCGCIKSVVGEMEMVSVSLIATRVKSACDAAVDRFEAGTLFTTLPTQVWTAIAESVGERT